VIQCNLRPILIDVDPRTLNMSLDSLRAALKLHRLRAVMMVHVLGNSTDLGELLKLVKEHELLLIEDTCESLGTRFGDAHLGTLGEFGTFSFYFSHHMTTIEGGMVLTKNEADDDLLRCLRSHGWSREQRNKQAIEANNAHIDPRFLFINLGYNLRPTELQAAFGIQQIGRLQTMNEHRRRNTERIREAFEQHPSWKEQLHFPLTPNGLDPCWFGFPFIVNPSVRLDYKKFTARLLAKGIDTRPIVSGNMALQPAIRSLQVDCSMGPFEGAQLVHERGVFIGCHAKPLEDQRIERLVSAVLEALT
jgi:CDP-6-deoxy-D-xylo-4-hexulose-3-dehydrase